MTPTGKMSREEWLEFRRPLTHVRKFIVDEWNRSIPKQYSYTEFWDNKQDFVYPALLALFGQDAWKEYRFPCVGASEISAIVGLNPYKSAIELFYEKVGIKPDYIPENEAMFWGKEGEAMIADIWQYWDGNKFTYIENFRNEQIQRKCRRINYYVQNKKFPWLFVSIDRIMNKGTANNEGVLECKEISGYAANMWETGIPPMYVAQHQTQLLVSELFFGELAIRKDGRYFDVYPFDRSEEIQAKMLSESMKFFGLVKSAIEQFLLAEYAPDENSKLHHMALVDNYSPEPDGSLSYRDYLADRYKDEGYEIIGGPIELELARDYKYFGKQIKGLEALQMERSNKIKAVMKDASGISFGTNGRCTWKQGKTSRTFQVYVEPPEDYLPEVVKAGGPIQINAVEKAELVQVEKS